MNKRTRTILFSICAILFLLIAPTITLYCMGYRINFNSKKIVQTGGFFFNVWPKNVQILIDGKIRSETGALFGSILIRNLLPGNYEVQIEKDGYLPWKKTLEIQEKMVTEAKNVFLIPENPSFETLTENVQDFTFSPDGKRMVLKDGNGLKFFDIEKGIKDYLIQALTEKESEEIIFSPDSQRVLLEINSKFEILDLKKFPPSSTSLDFLDPEIKEISFHPKDNTKIFFLKNQELFMSDIETKEVFPLEKDILTYKIEGGNIYYLNNSGFVFKSDLTQKIIEKINETAFKVKDAKNYQLEIFGNFIFLKEEDKLFLFNPDSKSFEKFFEPIKSLKISPDLKKLVYFNDHEIWVFFLKDSIDQPQKKSKDKVFLTRFSGKIEDCFWYTSHYLIFNIESKLKIIEIDDRDGLNTYDLSTISIQNELESPKIFFNEFDKKVYLLSGGKLFESEELHS